MGHGKIKGSTWRDNSGVWEDKGWGHGEIKGGLWGDKG